MAYEIPQQLEYKEKIIFNLTFPQLGWLFSFGSVILILFFKTNLDISLKIILTTLLSSLAAGFMFFNLRRYIHDWVGWFRVREIKELEKLKAFAGIKEITDNCIVRNDKRRIAVLKVEPINFAIKPRETQEAVTAMFQKFLNSIDFPVQLAIFTESINLGGHFTSLESKTSKNEQFQTIFRNYKGHLESLTATDKVTNRGFYLIIPEKNDLTIQVELCLKKLENIGLKSARIGDEGLLEIVKRYYNAQEQNTHPSPIENQPYYLKVGNVYSRTLYAHGYPRNVEIGFLDRIVSLLGNFDISLHIEPYEIEGMMIMLNRELQKQRADLYSAQLKGILNPSLEIKYSDTKSILENLQKGKEKLFNISLYIHCRADSKEALDMITRRVEAELNGLMIMPKQASFRMAQGFQSCAPLALNKLNATRNVTTEALSAFFPFTSSFLSADLSGIWFGLNKNNIPLIKDVFKLSNPNGICLASSGSGKSYLAKLMIARHLLNGTKVMVIDPQGEYRGLVERFKGQRVDLSRTSKTIINPLDLMGHDYPEKRLALMDLMPIMLGELTEPQKALIDRAMTEAYELKGIQMDEPESWENEPPKMEDVLNILKGMLKRAGMLEKPTISSLINRFSLYVDGVFSFLNKQTSINFDSDFVCFDIGAMPKQVKPVMMFLILDYVYMKMKEDLQRKLLVIDEAWSLLGRSEEATYVFEIVKTCRKFNLALFLINQEVEGMLASEAGKSVLANSSYTLLLRQKPAVIKGVQETFSLSSHERTFLLTAAVGEGILIMDDEHSEIKIIASPEEHVHITTNPDELLKQTEGKRDQEKPSKNVAQAKPIKQRSVRITVNPEIRFFRHRKLNVDDLKYLITKGHKQIKCLDISGHTENFLIRPRANESAEHCFLVFNIAELLSSSKVPFELFNSVKPDIVFKIGGKEYAVEVETGKVAKDKKKSNEKVKSLKQNYGKNWFFVVTDKNLVSTYSKFGPVYTKRNIAKKLQEIIKNG